MSILLEFREKLNWTQEELADKANISVRNIQMECELSRF